MASATPSSPPPPGSTLAALTAAFARAGPPLVGLEEELQLLDPATLDLCPCADEVVGGPDLDDRFRRELPAAQAEIVLPPAATVDAAAAQLLEARRALAARAAGRAILAGAGAHPFAAAEGAIAPGERYAELEREYRPAARRQLVFGLHVHVAVTGGARAVAVHDALRSHLPELAALAANAPFHDGRDSGRASVRPGLCDLLPRQGVPPALGSLRDYADQLDWGAAAGRLPTPRRWWWELRLHPLHGTVEVRVCDAQATVAETRAIAALVRALVHDLADRHDGGERLPVAPTWRIEENRWLAARDGLDAVLADPIDGRRATARTRLAQLVERLAPTAAALGDGDALAAVAGLLEAGGGAARQR
ncbi:carboxylate-amine ligase, partial [Patulibacter defluvii]|uniref:carboxylate-amine ligase n=1 Tax=Patulibacter defluvii TaxID=3095358 RepID=UPI002A765D09